MGTGYTRNDTANNIADGNIINAADLDGEFDAVEAAFNSSTGHTHDGTAAEGGAILVLGPSQEFVASSTEVKPSSNAGLSLGTSLLQFDDLYIDGSAYIDGLGESILVDGASKVQFRDTALFINSSADGQLDLEADTTIELTAPTVSLTDNLKLASDAAVLSFGADDEITVTHVHNTGLDLKNATGFDLNLQTSDTTVESGNLLGKITFNAPDEASGTDAIVVGASIEALAEATFDSSTNSTALVFKTNTSGAATERMRLTSAGDLHFLDNRKAIFGAGSDLQIYHSTHSYIEDAGGGDLILKASDQIKLQNGSGQNMAIFNENGAVLLTHSEETKLATTDAGIDVTGTVTADGLTVDDKVFVEGSNPYIVINDTDVTDLNTMLRTQSGVGYINTVNDAYNTVVKRLSVDHATGDISFYEDTGTTAKFFWDASNESLGINTTSFPSSKVKLAIQGDAGASGSNINIAADEFFIDNDGDTGMTLGSSNTGRGFYAFADSDVALRGGIFYDHSTDDMGFRVSSGTCMTITSSGNVGIGTSSPTSANGKALHIYENSANGAFLVLENTEGKAEVQGNNDGLFFDADSHTFRTQGGSSNFMSIDSSGNVGIGTISPAQKLHVSGGQLQITNGGTDVYLNSSTTNSYVYTTSTPFDIYTSGSPRVRVDTSGNVLVGTTNVNNNAEDGVRIKADGTLQVRSDNSGFVATLNRSNASDGDILTFAKSNTTVGSIGVQGGDAYYAGTSKGIKAVSGFIGATNTTGVLQDNNTDLGSSSYRFKDLYLSSGVVFDDAGGSGTSTSNTLDSYEEGTWTVGNNSDATGTIAANSYGIYRRIGDTVLVQCVFLVGANFTGNAISGLPFNPKNENTNVSSLHGLSVVRASNAVVFAQLSNGSNTISFHDSSGADYNPTTVRDPFRFTIMYRGV